jgi:hypothetical protein
MSMVPTLLALALAGCGGGSGSGASPAPAGATALTITSTNSKPLTADAIENAAGGDAAQVGASLVTGVQVDAGGAAGAAPQLAAVAQKLASMVPASASVATGVAINTTVNCSGGGSLTLSGNVSGGSGMVAGDDVTISAANCKETVGGVLETMSGTLRLQITAGSVVDTTHYPYHVVMSIKATNFSIASSGVSNATDGDLTLDMTANSATSQVSVLTSTSLSNNTTDSRGTRGATLKNYKQTQTLQGTSSNSDVTATVESTNSRLGTGAVKYDLTTPTPLVTNTSTGAYTAGSMKIVGANSSLLVTVTGSNTFSIQVDANGDGIYEASSTATLTELKALL